MNQVLRILVLCFVAGQAAGELSKAFAHRDPVRKFSRESGLGGDDTFTLAETPAEDTTRSIRDLVNHFMNQVEDAKLYEENLPDDCEDDKSPKRSPEEIAREFMTKLAGAKEEYEESENEEEEKESESEDSTDTKKHGLNSAVDGENIDVWLDGSWAASIKQPISNFDLPYNQEPAYIDEQGEYFDADDDSTEYSTDDFVASQNHISISTKWLFFLFPFIFVSGIHIYTKRISTPPYDPLLYHDLQEI